MSNLFGVMEPWCNRVADNLKLPELVREVVMSSGPYENDFEDHYDSNGLRLSNNPPFFNDANPKNLAPITPPLTPNGLIFPNIVGAFQSLNGPVFWDLIHQNIEPIPGNLKPEDLTRGNRNLLNPWLTLAGASSIFGTSLDQVTTAFDKTYLGYSSIMTTVEELRMGMIIDPGDLRDRLLTLFGVYTYHSPLVSDLLHEPNMRKCPASGRLLPSIIKAFGTLTKTEWPSLKPKFIQ